MIQMKESKLMSFISEAKKQATEKGVPQLMSWTKKIEPLSIIDAFKRTEKFGKNRLFWSNSNQDFILFGFGTTKVIIAESDRFEQLEQKWAALVEDALIYNPYEEQGTGLTAFGGMSFDPLRERSNLWTNFPMSQLTVPNYLIVYETDDYYLTVNQYINQTDHIDNIMKEINEVEQLLLTGVNVPNIGEQKIDYHIEKDPEGWKRSVQKAVDTIQADKAQKIVLARELRLKLHDRVQVSSFIEKLLESQPQSYIFAFEQGEDCFLGASPERLVQVREDTLLSTCLAGTAPRGKNEEEDVEIAKRELLHDPKNREEHDHVVQMIKSSVAPFCHDIYIPDKPVVLTLRNLQHLYTPVTATLNDGVSVFKL